MNRPNKDWQYHSLMNAFRNILNSDAYSDMKVRLSDGTEVNCHRAIVCGRCDFFKTALQAGFKESHTGVIEMFNDPPQAVRTMIHYFYTENYPEYGLKGPELVLFHLDMYIIAATYLVEGLAKIAKSRMVQKLETAPEVLPDIWNALLEFNFKFLRYPELKGPGMALAKWAIQKFECVDKETWDVITKESSSFMQYVTEKAWGFWERQCVVDAARWLEHFEGPDSTGRTVFQASRCPGRCGYVPGGVTISRKGTAMARCNGCGIYFASSRWYSDKYSIYEEQVMRLYDGEDIDIDIDEEDDSEGDGDEEDDSEGDNDEEEDSESH